MSGNVDDYWTKTATSVTCDTLFPSVPVTLTVYDPAGVPVPPPPPELLLPPQPTAARIRASVTSVSAMLSLLRFVGIANTSTPANTPPLPPNQKGKLLGVSPAAA